MIVLLGHHHGKRRREDNMGVEWLDQTRNWWCACVGLVVWCEGVHVPRTFGSVMVPP